MDELTTLTTRYRKPNVMIYSRLGRHGMVYMPNNKVACVGITPLSLSWSFSGRVEEGLLPVFISSAAWEPLPFVLTFFLSGTMKAPYFGSSRFFRQQGGPVRQLQTTASTRITVPDCLDRFGAKHCTTDRTIFPRCYLMTWITDALGFCKLHLDHRRFSVA